MALLTRNNDHFFTRDPFAEIDRMFNDLVNSADSLPNRMRRGFSDIGMTKTADVGDSRVIKVALPGVSAEDLELDIHNSYLRWRVDTSSDEGDFVSKAQGSYYLGDDLDTNAVDADLSNGVLTVTVGYKSKPDPVRIDVRSGGTLDLGSSVTDELRSGTAPMTERKGSSSSAGENIAEDRPDSGGEPAREPELDRGS